MPVFTKAHAEDTEKKLKTKSKTDGHPRLTILEVKDGAHLVQQVWCNGQFVTKFGIKHASNRNNSHGWVRDAFDLSPREIYDFAICQMSIDDMIRHLILRGDIELDPVDEDALEE